MDKKNLRLLILEDNPDDAELEILELKREGFTLKLPVVVLTSSKEEQDKIDSFNLGVAGYMLKPVDYHQFVEIIQTIDLYWTISEFPGDI